MEGKVITLTSKRTLLCQRILWHIRWLLLVGIIIFNFIAYHHFFDVPIMICMTGSGFALYFFLWQIEGYMECRAQCNRNGGLK